jgi:hypothetical protein
LRLFIDPKKVKLQTALAQLEKLSQDRERQLTQEELRRCLYEMGFLRTQKLYLAAINDPRYFIVVVTSSNQWGKSWIHIYDLISESLGFQPHDGTQRPRTAYDIALVLRDYDNHARKVLHQNVYRMVPREFVKVETTQKSAPRIIQVTDPVSGVEGKPIHIFTHDQDWDRLEGGTWQRIGVDEPCPRTHFTALIRGLQQTGGKCSMTMTPLSEPWIFDDVYDQAVTNGGPREDIYAITAWPDENLRSNGGFLEDERVHAFRESMPKEEQEARVHGRWLHLIGRVYKEFDERVHVKPHAEIMRAIDEDPDPMFVLVVDPHDRLPFAMSWTYVASDNTFYIFKEFPDEPFEKIHSNHYTYDHYSQIIFRGPPTRFRIMDPNSGRRRVGVTGRTVADEMAIRSQPNRPLGFDTTVDDDVQAGHQAVRERLFYDNATGQLPKLYVSDVCRNHITGFRNYTWDEYRGRNAEGRERKQKPRERYKHYMDCMRYLCMYPISSQAPTRQQAPRREFLNSWRKQVLPNEDLLHNPFFDQRPASRYESPRRYHGRI